MKTAVGMRPIKICTFGISILLNKDHIIGRSVACVSRKTVDRLSRIDEFIVLLPAACLDSSANALLGTLTSPGQASEVPAAVDSVIACHDPSRCVDSSIAAAE
jgi:hypothetical protein